MRSTVVTYVNPAVAVLLGVTILGEPFGVATGGRLCAGLAGSFLATRPLRAPLPSGAWCRPPRLGAIAAPVPCAPRAQSCRRPSAPGADSRHRALSDS